MRIRSLFWPRCQYCGKKTQYPIETTVGRGEYGQPMLIHGTFCHTCAEMDIQV